MSIYVSQISFDPFLNAIDQGKNPFVELTILNKTADSQTFFVFDPATKTNSVGCEGFLERFFATHNFDRLVLKKKTVQKDFLRSSPQKVFYKLEYNAN
jgi:hypothetical protein